MTMMNAIFSVHHYADVESIEQQLCGNDDYEFWNRQSLTFSSDAATRGGQVQIKYLVEC